MCVSPDRIITMDRKLVSLMTIGMIFFLGAAAFGIWRYQERQWTTFVFDNPKFSFDYPQVLKLEPLPDEEQKSLKVLFRASQGELPDELNVNLRQETGLRLPLTLTKQEMISMLLSNAADSFPQRFPDFKKVAEREFAHAGKRAAELYFTYTGPAGEKIKQRLLIIAYDGDTALYFATQSKTSDFDELNRKYFDRMFESLGFG